MFRFKYLFLILIIPWFLFSCTENEPLAPETVQAKPYNSDLEAFNNLAKGNNNNGLRVMTRNIYVGSDVDIVLGADDPAQVPILVAQVFQGLIATNFPERAVSLAKEIALTKPHLIGLQEVSLLRIQSPGDAVIGGTVPAVDTLMNYLEIFMKTLDSFGLKYKIAGKIQNFDVEMPMLTGNNPLTFDDVRLTDFDIVLVLDEVQVSNVSERNYQVNLPIPDLGIEITRGYIALDARVGRKTYRFANTHLESFYLPVRNAQAQELTAALDNSPYPIVLLGDFNSPAPLGETYQYVLSQGYVDTWTQNALDDSPDGFTFGHDPDLLNPEAHFSERIDHIYVKNNSSPKINFPDLVISVVVGDEQFNRTPSGLWPSDHGGVVARLRIASEQAPYFSQSGN